MANSMRQRLADAALGRLLRQAPAVNDYTVATVHTRMRDGVVLLGDHFTPVTPRPRGTVLIRTPYGRGFPSSALNGRLFAARGYHVVIQSVRGTFGSGGRFEPMAQETADGHDTVVWLREQPWFDGRLATLGASYLGWAQWTMLQDPPPELRTAVVYVAPHDFREAVFGTGAFTVGDFLGWSDMIAHQEDGGLLRRAASGMSAQRRLRPALGGVPLPDAADPVLQGRAPWYREWLSHPDGDDPWWAPYRAGEALSRVDVPVLLISGWQDLFLDQTLQQYEALRARGVEVGLTVGPWTHLQIGLQGAAVVARESLAWLDQHMADGPPARTSPVRVFRTGERRWHRMAAWPPPSAPAVFQLHADHSLTLSATPPPAEPASSPRADQAAAQPLSAGDETLSFRYDPADPTPTAGGRTLTGSMGVKDNRSLEARPDVLVFTTDPLPTAVDVIGTPVLDLAVAVDPAHADVFVRLCDVDSHGRSRNFADRMLRLDPAVPVGEVQHLTLTLDPCFHRLAAGHRLRLQISGGSFPRFARNLGTPGAPAEAHTLWPQDHTVHCARSRLTLPVAATEGYSGPA
ncbi:CocE/NonD family hydrolase [Actinoplanes solisilvae]|uniref:CocE/NonD family hydrolase n=1 Tax=Actinoplanes solisilvae TaxID=2486853 RepID=UPI000FD78130|nr:CocE/NonD family hydrolase [Actinoplanes solisilvae]